MFSCSLNLSRRTQDASTVVTSLAFATSCKKEYLHLLIELVFLVWDSLHLMDPECSYFSLFTWSPPQLITTRAFPTRRLPAHVSQGECFRERPECASEQPLRERAPHAPRDQRACVRHGPLQRHRCPRCRRRRVIAYGRDHCARITFTWILSRTTRKRQQVLRYRSEHLNLMNLFRHLIRAFVVLLSLVFHAAFLR